MRIRDPQDFWAGVMFAAIGLLVMYGAQEYDYGTAAKMGPGYFPTWLGGLLALLGLIVGGRGLIFEGKPISQVHWKPLILVLLAIAIFGAVLQSLGFVVAIFFLIIVACLGGHEFRLKEVLILTVGLTIGSVLIFNYGLSLQFPVWPW